MNTTEVIAALEAPSTDRRGVMRQLEEEAPHASLVGALAADRPLTRQLAADILGRRAEPESAGALGAAHHREAIPLLRAAAGSEDRGLALAAQWALEQLG
jgi:HEAT repeat protein